jgi:hypothetical protein
MYFHLVTQVLITFIETRFFLLLAYLFRSLIFMKEEENLIFEDERFLFNLLF